MEDDEIENTTYVLSHRLYTLDQKVQGNVV